MISPRCTPIIFFMNTRLQSELRQEIYDRFIYFSQLHVPREKMEQELIRLGINEAELASLRKYFTDEERKKRHHYGIALTVAGSILLIVGFILTAVLYHKDSPLQLVMYGFTGFGLALLVIGLYCLF